MRIRSYADALSDIKANGQWLFKKGSDELPFLCTTRRRILGKSQIIRRIHRAALKYKEVFVGNTFMFVFENDYVEVMFKKSSFMHLTGVASLLRADDFYNHALTEHGLRPGEIFFNEDHPYDLADKKTGILIGLSDITDKDAGVVTDIETKTFSYKLGVANMKFTVCLGDDKNSLGEVQGKCKVPYSFRVEGLNSNKSQNIYSVTHVFKKKTGEKKYSILTYGDIGSLKYLKDEIQEKIEIGER